MKTSLAFTILLLFSVKVLATAKITYLNKSVSVNQYMLSLEKCHDQLSRFQIPMSIMMLDSAEDSPEVEFKIQSPQSLLLSDFCNMALLTRMSELLKNHEIIYSSLGDLDKGGFLYVHTRLKRKFLQQSIEDFETLESVRAFDQFRLNAIYYVLLALLILFVATRIYYKEDQDA